MCRMQVLISLNPFKRLPIYGAAAMAEYSEPSPNRLQSPHTFAIANSAYRALWRADKKASISILISGESGAGKTECTKQCLQFLAEVAGSVATWCGSAWVGRPFSVSDGPVQLAAGRLKATCKLLAHSLLEDLSERASQQL